MSNFKKMISLLALFTATSAMAETMPALICGANEAMPKGQPFSITFLGKKPTAVDVAPRITLRTGRPSTVYVNFQNAGSNRLGTSSALISRPIVGTPSRMPTVYTFDFLGSNGNPTGVTFSVEVPLDSPGAGNLRATFNRRDGSTAAFVCDPYYGTFTPRPGMSGHN